MRAISSGGERFLDAEEVSGSNPLSPTRLEPTASYKAWAEFSRMSGSGCKYVSGVMLTEACSSIAESICRLRRTPHEGIMLVVEKDVSL